MTFRIPLATAALVLAASVAGAQTPPSQDDHAAHHPAGSDSAPTAAPPRPGAPMGMGMMGGMSGHGGMMGGGMMGAMHGGGAMGEIPGLPFRHVEGRIAFLKAELKITDAQQPLWSTFADAYRAAAKAAGATAAPAAPTTVPERLARHESALATKLDAVKAIRAALDPLYAALTADQKKLAEEFMSPRGMM